jgi:hypothetical protein
MKLPSPVPELPVGNLQVSGTFYEQPTGRISARFHAGGTIAGCDKEVLICVGASFYSACS